MSTDASPELLKALDAIASSGKQPEPKKFEFQYDVSGGFRIVIYNRPHELASAWVGYAGIAQFVDENELYIAVGSFWGHPHSENGLQREQVYRLVPVSTIVKEAGDD